MKFHFDTGRPGVTFFACSMSNEGRGRPVVLLTDNLGQVEKFVEDLTGPGAVSTRL
jgi:hypothetical protein